MRLQKGREKMSGYKHATVTISQEEYRRLHDADMKRKFRESGSTRAQSASREAEIQSLLQILEERERQLEAALGSIDQNAYPVGNEILQDILSQNAMFYDNLAASFQETSSNDSNTIASLSEEYSRALQQERERHQLHLQSIIENQDAYHYQEYAKEDAARQWINRCLVLAELIRNQYDHERFMTGRLSRIVRNLEFAENNLAAGFSEAGIQGCQQIYCELSDLQFKLEQTLIRWHTEFDKTHSAISELVQQIECNARVNALGIEGEELPNEVDLDFWTSGKYGQLLDHCRQLSVYMVSEQSCLNEEDINRIYSQILPVVRESFESIIYEARLNALNSQLRMNIAEKALQALEIHGFVLEQAGYEGNDMRSQFTARLDNPDGSQVMIQVVPPERSSDELSNELFVITSSPSLKTEHEARLRWEELTQTLNRFNLRVGRPEVLSSSSESSSSTSENSRSVEHQYTRTES